MKTLFSSSESTVGPQTITQWTAEAEVPNGYIILSYYAG